MLYSLKIIGNYFLLLFRALHSRKTGKCTDAAELELGSNLKDFTAFAYRNGSIFARGILTFCPMKRLPGRQAVRRKSWTRFYGYRERIRITAIEWEHIDRDTKDSIKQRLAAALFKFRFDEQSYLGKE